MSKPILDHVIRFDVPWRRESKTECGRDTTDVRQIITRDELIAKWKREGQMRAAYTTCMTCLDRSKVARSWDEDPAGIITREFGNSFYGTDKGATRRELRAIAMVVMAHRDEFEQALAGLAGTPSLDEKRRTSTRRILGGASRTPSSPSPPTGPGSPSSGSSCSASRA
jgi:hypothetical protein